MLARWWCRAGGHTQSMGWGFTFPIMAQKVCYWKISDVVKETGAKKVMKFKFNLEIKHVAAHWCWQGGGAGQDAKLSLWAEFLPFSCWDRSNSNEKIIRHSYEKIVKNMTDIKPHHKNIPTTAYWCWQGGGAGREAKLSLWSDFWPFPWKDHRWWIEKNESYLWHISKNLKGMKTHHKNILAAACCCWQGGGVGREG